jgi:enoyl-CoA hydratase/carnithine racemase
MRENVPPEELMQQYGSERNVWKKFNQEHHYFLSEMRLNKWRRIPKPTIAMVHSYAIYGGFFNAAAMDIVFASEDALFLPQIGCIDTGTWDFGPRKFLEIMYEHRFITARECYELGFVNRIYPNYEILERETLAYANRVADNDTLMKIRFTKLSVNHTRDLQGFHLSCEDAELFNQMSLYFEPPEEAHVIRYEGSGIGRTPRALANLKAKLESEGKEVPQKIIDALERAEKRDDKARWEKATQQSWRDKRRREAAKAEAEARAEKDKQQRKPE